MTFPAVDDFTVSYGGSLVNYSPTENPQTDLDASFANAERASVAAMSICATRAIIQFKVSSSTATVVSSVQGWVESPTVTWSATGTYLCSFPAMVTDVTGVLQNLNLRYGHANFASATGAANYFIPSVLITSANTFTVWLTNAGGPALADPLHASDVITVFVQ